VAVTGGHIRDTVMRAGFLALICCLSSSAFPRGDDGLVQVRAEGYADGIGFAARRRAVEAATRDAVAQFVQSLVAREDAAALEPLLGDPGRYVDHADLLRQEDRGDSTFVEVDVYVAERSIQRDVAELMLPRLGAAPEVLLVIGEQFIQDEVPAVIEGGIAEQALIEALGKKGVAARGVDAVPDDFSHPELLGAVGGDVETGGLFARAMTADVVVLGTAVARTTAIAAGSNLLRNEAAITLRVFRAFDGKMTDALSSRHVVHAADPRAGGRQALRDAALRLAEDARVSAVITVLGTRAEEGVQLTLERPGTRARLEKVLGAIRGVPGVAGMEERFYSDRLARYVFQYTGPMSWLVDEVRDRSFDGAPLKVMRVVGNEMRLSFP